MYVMQNALKNLGRNKEKNILLGIIVFSRIVTTVVTIAISRATSAVIAEYKQQFDSEVSFKNESDESVQCHGIPLYGK